MKVKTSELTGPALDSAVARVWYGNDYEMVIPLFEDGLIFAPSTNWAHGGPIIEREGIRFHRSYTGAWWAGSEEEPHRPIKGPTPLIAAMRCYVASRLGDEVEVPDSLRNTNQKQPR